MSLAKEQVREVVCANPRCGKSFEHVGANHRMYCSTRCEHQASRVREQARRVRRCMLPEHEWPCLRADTYGVLSSLATRGEFHTLAHTGPLFQSGRN
jgi:hypothetical protein